MHRLIVAERGNDLTLGISGYQLTEEVVKHYIINNDSSHNGWVQPERMENNAQNIGPQLSSFTGALHGMVKRPALVVQRLTAAAVMFRFTKHFFAVFAHNIAPQIKVILHAGWSNA